MQTQNGEEVPINIVGSSTFGRYPKISLEKTYNMFISDGWLVNYMGFQNVLDIFDEGEGRGIFLSTRGNFVIAVFNNSVYKISNTLSYSKIGSLDTSSGEVTIDENLSSQIAIADGNAMWIYNYSNNTFTKQTLSFLGNEISPSYVSYHNTFFLVTPSPTNVNPQNWYAFEFDTLTTIKLNKQFSIQTKPDTALAVTRIPGRGNNIIVIGSAVSEVWTQVGGTENYRRIQSFNIDNGAVSASTISTNETYVAWLCQSENNAPSIMWTDGSAVQRISTDGIDYVMQTLKRPDKSTAFFVRKDGHLFYQITFFDPKDNLTLVYDFNTQKFFHLSDENLDYYPARQAVYFNKKTYFVSINSASLYEMDSEIVSYNYTEKTKENSKIIPRIRICKSIRKDDSSRFIANMVTFWIEQGVTDFTFNGTLERPRIDMSFSKNGNQSFSNVVSRELNPQAHFKNQLRWRRMGICNEFTPKFRFEGMNRFLAYDGIMEIK